MLATAVDLHFLFNFDLQQVVEKCRSSGLFGKEDQDEYLASLQRLSGNGKGEQRSAAVRKVNASAAVADNATVNQILRQVSQSSSPHLHICPLPMHPSISIYITP